MLNQSSKDGFSVSCDSCPEVVDLETKDFGEALNKMRELGWVAIRTGNAWEHECPDCHTC